ncbi:MAG: electron transfer flavoprotein subunit beta/FixA family protein [Bacteroidales bacterium]|nr:electron transfer flavoprotein subunit beta/FixA family protein [Bacteroidales bacterium]MDZ4203327.1 electron transfer flavoprotein subunit beta/FixA family protein [Bacteroidales bacterium]
MKILVCISNVPDTTTRIAIGPDGKSISTAGIQWIINPWDELALTRALELKDVGRVTEVVVANVGPTLTEATLRKALATGADRALRVNTEPTDAWSVAINLAELIKNEAFDVILCGIESSDHNGSVVGGLLAGILDMNIISSVSGLDIEGDTLKVQREIAGGKELHETSAPVVLVVQKGIALAPRIPSMRGIMMARTKPLLTSDPVSSEPMTATAQLFMPKAKGACRMVDAENAGDLIRLLHEEAKVI